MNCYQHKDGHKVYTESTGEPLLDRKGRLLKWRGVDHNITSRKRFEDELRQRNRAIEAASVGISISDATAPGYPVTYVNPALCKITGYSREEIIGHSLRMLQGSETDPVAVLKIFKALLREKECEVTVKNYRKDGTMFWNELIISPVRDESGRLTHFISIHADVTERRHAEEQRHELEMARQIQLTLLPKLPLKLPNVQVFGTCVPASHVSGDYFDYFPVGEDLDVVIADVSGHSLGSALMMAEVRITIKEEALQKRNGLTHGPSDNLQALNEWLFEDLDGADLFISMFCLRYNPKNRQLQYANAGHNTPFLLRSSAPSCEPLDAEGMVLGVQKKVEFEEAAMNLSPGDRMLLYTDGLVETRNDADEFFGQQRLCQLFTFCRELPPQLVVEAILGELRQFRGGTTYEDDVTLVVVQVT
jgi:sigma-B regulation protein RsbU (phosphoserine phosphatase)